MVDTRRCIGSARFGIEPHDALVTDFPAQASQKDGLGRMCRTHWNQYTKGLARDAKARKATAATEPAEAAAFEPSVESSKEAKAATSPRRPPRAAVGAEVAEEATGG